MPEDIHEPPAKKKSRRGGARPGAGRKPGFGHNLRKVLQVCLSPGDWEAAQRSGGSSWARSVIKAALGPLPEGSQLVAQGAPRRKTAFFQAQAQCGFPSPALDYEQDDIDFNEFLAPHPQATFLVRAIGDSMADAGISSGDMLVVDRSLSAVPGRIVLARIDAEFTVKRLAKSAAGTLELRAENAAASYPVLAPREGQEWELIGVVTSIIKSV